MVRLQKFLAEAGVASRRAGEKLILEGRVAVNDEVVRALGTKVEPGADAVSVDGTPVRPKRKLYIALNKPPGFLCTRDDPEERRTIGELLPREWRHLASVGRLDRDSEGLLLVTNDGALSLSLTHPRYKIEKEYEVRIDKPFDPAHRAKLLRGFHIIGGRAKAESVDIVSPQLLKIVLLQGIKRQIRLMLYELGYEVVQLCRMRIGPLKAGKLKPGEWRLITPRELEALKGRKESGS